VERTLTEERLHWCTALSTPWRSSLPSALGPKTVSASSMSMAGGFSPIERYTGGGARPRVRWPAGRYVDGRPASCVPCRQVGMGVPIRGCTHQLGRDRADQWAVRERRVPVSGQPSAECRRMRWRPTHLDRIVDRVVSCGTSDAAAPLGPVVTGGSRRGRS
jgi:hypothetical protein